MIIDKDLIYNPKRRRYTLTSEYVKNVIGLDLNAVLYDELDSNPTSLPKRTLEYTSNMLYDYLQMQSADYKYALQLIENDVETHEAFKDALYYQLVYFIEAGDLAISADGDLSKMISKRALQILYSQKLLTQQAPRKLPKRVLNDIFYGDGGGIY